jgi:hypothetical protein
MNDHEKLSISKGIAENLRLIASEMDVVNEIIQVICDSASFEPESRKQDLLESLEKRKLEQRNLQNKAETLLKKLNE